MPSTVLSQLRVSEVIVDRLREYARQRGITQAQAHRLILAEALRDTPARPTPVRVIAQAQRDAA